MKSSITLVIGSSGLIGSALVAQLRSKGSAVIGIDALDSLSTTYTRSVGGFSDIKDIWDDVAIRFEYVSVVFTAGKNGSVEHGGLTDKYGIDHEDEIQYFRANVLIPQDIALGIIESCERIYTTLRVRVWIVVSHYGHKAANNSLYPDGQYKPIGYITSKHAALGLVKALATRFSGERISINGFSPGGILNDQPAQFQKKYSDYVPIGRLARIDEIAIWMALVMNPLNPVYATGTIFNVDGGVLSW